MFVPPSRPDGRQSRELVRKSENAEKAAKTAEKEPKRLTPIEIHLFIYYIHIIDKYDLS